MPVARKAKAPAPPPERKRWWRKITRDLVLFVVGLGFAYNELVIRSGPERPSSLLFITGLLGLVPVLRFEEALRRRRDDDGR